MAKQKTCNLFTVSCFKDTFLLFTQGIEKKSLLGCLQKAEKDTYARTGRGNPKLVGTRMSRVNCPVLHSLDEKTDLPI